MKSLRWIDDEMGAPGDGREWVISKCFENGSGAIWSRQIPWQVFIALVGPGLRVLLPVFEEKLANFRLWPVGETADQEQGG